MPELPEVETILRGLEKQIKNTIICDLQSYYKRTVYIDQDVIRPIFPSYVTNYSRRGKYIILTLTSGNAVVIHLRMTGKLIYIKNLNPNIKHIRASFTLKNGYNLIFKDIRTFGKIIVCPQIKVSDYLPALGVEPLSDNFNATYLKQILSVKKASIKTVLLDQTVIAGLGNIYVCEILYRAKIHPETSAQMLTINRLKHIVLQTKVVLTEALEHNGTSISDYRQIDDKIGEFQNFLRVYQKEYCPKGHQIKRIKQAGRSTFFCPICQLK